MLTTSPARAILPTARLNKLLRRFYLLRVADRHCREGALGNIVSYFVKLRGRLWLGDFAINLTSRLSEARVESLVGVCGQRLRVRCRLPLR